MNQNRRELLRIATVMGLAITAGILKPGSALAADWNGSGFDAKTLEETLKKIGAAGAAVSADVAVNGPEIAENGAVVPIAVASTLPNVTGIAILVLENPNTLAAAYKIPEGTEASVASRLKMAKTSKVMAVVESGGKLFTATKEVKVTVGGCGG